MGTGRGLLGKAEKKAAIMAVKASFLGWGKFLILKAVILPLFFVCGCLVCPI